MESRAGNVEFYAGSRADEEPRVLRVDGRRVEVDAILERARAPEGRMFRVRGDDGRAYVLREEGDAGAWTIS